MGLGKTFINSITREVGRNVGKGISNDLFGDWHSTPVRIAQKNAKKQGFDLSFVKDDEYDVSIQPEYKFDGYLTCFFLYGMLGTILILPIFFAWLQILVLLLKKKTNLYAKIPMRRPDGRTKIGFREVGNTYVKLKSKRLLNDEEKKNTKLCALFIFLGQVVVFCLALYVSELPTN
jgi:hypothetical protein